MGTAETKAKRKYNNKAYDRLFVSVKKGKKKSIGMSQHPMDSAV